MRKESFCTDEDMLMSSIAGQLYEQAPNHTPRNADIIMTKVRDKFREHAYLDKIFNSYSMVISIENNGLYNYIHDLVYAIPEFVDLNLSQYEYENGVKVDDPDRGKYMFIDRYSVVPWENSFIDLEAFIQNVVYKLKARKNLDTDCFFCANEDTDICKTCFFNPEFKNGYECKREPKGKYTKACKYDCFKSKYICCDECKDECENRCIEDCKTCQNNLNKE